MFKIAVPNKGSLSEAAQQILRESGYRQRSDGKELVLTDATNNVEFYYLRPRDIAVYVGEGTLDVGITGRDMLLDSGADAVEVMTLGFGATRFRYAGPAHLQLSVSDLAGKRIATSYPGLVSADLRAKGIEARLIKLDGAVESAIRLGVADAIADVVETGRTLRQAGMDVFGEPILHSEAILIRRSDVTGPTGLEQLQRRLTGVLVARHYVMLDYDCPESLVEQAALITPGLESPTVSPLARQGWVAVRAMVPSTQAQQLMDDLWDLGARAILITDIAACRL